MKSLNLKGKQRKNKYKSYKGEVGKVAANILARDFNCERPYEKLTTDITEFNVCEKKLYLSPIMDLYNREILCYEISDSPNFRQTREMLAKLDKVLPEKSKTYTPLRPRVAIPDERIPKNTCKTQYKAKYVKEGKLPGQQSDGELFWQT